MNTSRLGGGGKHADGSDARRPFLSRAGADDERGEEREAGQDQQGFQR